MLSKMGVSKILSPGCKPSSTNTHNNWSSQCKAQQKQHYQKSSSGRRSGGSSRVEKTIHSNNLGFNFFCSYFSTSYPRH